MFKNMKIEINEVQPLDEIVIELERLGYVKPNSGGDKVYTSQLGNTVNVFDGSMMFDCYKLTTLQQLKEMKCKI